INFDPLTVRGIFSLTIGPDVRDTAGNQMDQNQNNISGEAADRSINSLVYISANVIFTTNSFISEANLALDGKDLLVHGVTLTVDRPHDSNSVHLINGGILTHTANSSTQTHKLDLTITEQLIVDSSSRIDVSGKGYQPGRTTGNTTVGAATGDSSGSYGGL